MLFVCIVHRFCAKGAGISAWLSTQQQKLAKGLWPYKGNVSSAGLVFWFFELYLIIYFYYGSVLCS